MRKSPALMRLRCPAWSSSMSGAAHRINLTDRQREVAQRRATGPTQEDVSEGGMLRRVCALIYVQGHAPGRSGFIVVVPAGKHHVQPRQFDVVHVPVTDNPGQPEVAHPVRRSPAQFRSLPPARTDGVAVADLKIGACYLPRTIHDSHSVIHECGEHGSSV